MRRDKEECTSASLLQSGLNEVGGQIQWNVVPICENVTDLLSDGKTPNERRFWAAIWRTNIPFGSFVEYHPIAAKDQSRIHQFGKKVLLGLFFGYALLYAVWIWKGDVLVADRDLKSTREDSKRKRWYFPKERGEFIFPIAGGRSKPLEEIRDWEHPPWYGRDQFKERVTLTFLENQKGLFHNLKTFLDACEARNFFLVQVRKLHIPPSRWTQSQTLLTERRIIPYSTEVHWRLQNYTQIWILSKGAASMIIGISMGQETYWILGQVALFSFEEKLPDGFLSSGGEINKKTADIQARSLMARTLEVGKNVELKERQKWSHEKPQLDNARKLLGIEFIDFEDNEFKEIIKNAHKKLETPVTPAVPCKTSKKSQHWVTHGESNEIKSKFACILEASESTRLLQDHIEGNQFITTWYTNSFLCFTPSKSQQQQQQWKRNGKNWGKFLRGTWVKSEVKRRWSMKQGRRVQKFTLHH